MRSLTAKRDFEDGYEDDNDGSWWYGPQAAAIKWSIVGAIFLLALLWFFGGYYHAQRRMRKGLQPLAYHRWLLPRSQRLRFQGQNQFPYNHQHNGYDGAYQMQGYPAPPPAYNPAFAPPPSYQPPTGASKVDPHQDWAIPPPGPPPTSESSSTGQQIITPPTQGYQNLETSPGEYPTLSVQPSKRSLMKRLNPFK